MATFFEKAAKQKAEAEKKKSGPITVETTKTGELKAKYTGKQFLRGTGMTARELEREEKKATKSFSELLREQKERKDALEKAESVVLKRPVFEDVPKLKPAPTSHLVLDQYQQAALDGLRHEQFGCLIGAAGTGKTTVLKELVRELEIYTPTIDLNGARIKSKRTGGEDLNVAIAFASFTGRAVQQMKRALPKEYHPMCSTIHAMLGYAPVYEERWDEEKEEVKIVKVFKPTFTSTNKLPWKVIILDECGMLGAHLWNQIVDAMQPDTRVIMVGDINQLPPPFGKSVLGFAMINWPTFTLEKIHRQAADNPIIANAHNILQGKMPKPDAKFCPIVTTREGSGGMQTTLLNTVKILHQNAVFDEFHDAVIVPQNKGTIGQTELNQLFVHYFNRPIQQDGIWLNKRQQIKAGSHWVHFAVNDKVMLLQNNPARQLTNGMIGRVTSIVLNGNFDGNRANMDQLSSEVDHTEHDGAADFDLTEELEAAVKKVEEDASAKEENQRQASHIMTVEFYLQTAEGDIEDVEVEFSTAGDFRNIALAYAFTCHKAQGAEFPTVVIGLHSANAVMLCREWLYTAYTRAQERCVLVCNNRGLLQALKNQKITGKTVKEKAEQFLALSESLPDEELPVLPEPARVELRKAS